MNDARGKGSSHDADINLREMLTQWWFYITKGGGGGGQESWKKWLDNLNYVIN